MLLRLSVMGITLYVNPEKWAEELSEFVRLTSYDEVANTISKYIKHMDKLEHDAVHAKATLFQEVMLSPNYGMSDAKGKYDIIEWYVIDRSRSWTDMSCSMTAAYLEEALPSEDILYLFATYQLTAYYTTSMYRMDVAAIT